MAYMTDEEVGSLGFRHVGRGVKISTRAAIYDADRISIGDHSRIDDFTVLAGSIDIGRNVHVTVFCNLAGGRAGLSIGDFCTFAYGCHLIAQTDDYTGATMTNSTLPLEYRTEIAAPVVLGRHVILGTGTVVLPGLTLGEGTASGARTLFLESSEPWTIYVGQPARAIRERSRALLDLERRYLANDGG